MTDNSKKGKMFRFITTTWNPVVGCYHNCVYCWARKLAETRLKNTPRYKEGFKPQLIEKEFQRTFKEDDFVFVCDMGDLFGSWVQHDWIQRVLTYINKFPKTTFLLLTKNPRRYGDFSIPNNCVCAATIESDIDHEISQAPHPHLRLLHMTVKNHPHKAVIIEPILKFNLTYFITMLKEIKPQFTVVGYDNYHNNLPEPTPHETHQLIQHLQQFTTTYTKTLH